MPPAYAVRSTCRDFPSDDEFRKLVRAIERSTGRNPLLQGRIVASTSRNRGNIGGQCIVLCEDTLNSEGYYTLGGSSYPSIYHKTSQTWPRRLHRKSLRKLVCLHEWIAASVWGPKPNQHTFHATHVCGNSQCVAAKHIRYQTINGQCESCRYSPSQTL